MAIEIDRLPASRRVSGPQEPLLARVNRALRGSPRVSARDRMFFTERVALLLSTNIPIHTALESLTRQPASGALGQLLTRVHAAVVEGKSFAGALRDHPEIFPRTYTNLVNAAEVGGFLPKALERLRDMEERRQDLRSTLSSAISYPAFLAVFSVAVVVFVLVVVFPKFDDLFEMLGDQLPLSTRVLMVTSDILTRFWPLMLGGLSAAGVALQRWLARPEGMRAVDRLLLGIPIVRDIVIHLNVVQLLRVLALSLENGVPAVDALSAAQDGVSSGSFREFLGRVIQGVREGRGIARGFESEELLPELVKQLVATGEESGNLAPVMHRLADFYEREWRRSLGIVAKIAEPAMLMVMGCVVGLVVSSLILPIFKVSRVVH